MKNIILILVFLAFSLLLSFIFPSTAIVTDDGCVMGKQALSFSFKKVWP